MSVKNLFLLIGLCVLFTACSTGRYGDGRITTASTDTSTGRGVRYLLGRGVPRNDERAFYYFSQAANQEDAFAQNELAYLYASGKGTKQDYGQALLYYQKAAQHGLASAQYNLGMMYLHGLGTAPNQTLALEWFKKSAERGFEPAQLALKQRSSSLSEDKNDPHTA